MKAYSVRTADDEGCVQYGVKTVRQLRNLKKVDLLSRDRTSRQKQKQAAVFEYFRSQVDPIIQECVAFLLCAQPQDTAGVMLDYMSHWRDGRRKEYVLPEGTTKTTKAQRIYLATQINPIITRIVTEIAKVRPEDVVLCIIDELVRIIAEFKTGNLQEEAPCDLPPGNVKRPATADSIRSPRRAEVAAHGNQLGGGPSASARPESAPVAASSPKPLEAVVMEIQIAMLGIADAGKTSVINNLQGKDSSNVRPTNGFRPVTMMLGEDVKIRFYDLGGGKKIRDIWEQYYHDTHGYIYVVDSASSPESLQEAADVYRKVTQHPYVGSKPGLILANKRDKENAVDLETLKQILALSSNHSIQLEECSCSPKEDAEVVICDPRLEQALMWLLDQIRGNFSSINEKVRLDTSKKEAEDAIKRIAKERSVLRNKIACAFLDQVDRSTPGLNVDSANPNDLFGDVDGPKFLAGEIGVDIDSMDPVALEVSNLVGNQRLALQMIGAMNVPINKKKIPMSWHEIRSLVVELRQELGLPPYLL